MCCVKLPLNPNLASHCPHWCDLDRHLIHVLYRLPVFSRIENKLFNFSHWHRVHLPHQPASKEAVAQPSCHRSRIRLLRQAPLHNQQVRRGHRVTDGAGDNVHHHRRFHRRLAASPPPHDQPASTSPPTCTLGT